MDSRINDEAQALAREGAWVQATREFGYDEELGQVKRGQVFQLGGHRNDAGLIRHALLQVLDPPPKAADVKKFPSCGECGRVFINEHLRDLCGESHEEPSEEAVLDRRAKVHDRVLQDLEERVFPVGT